MPKGKVEIILEGVEFVMEAVTFTSFIYQEALQTAFLALGTAIKAKRYRLAASIHHTIETDIYPPFDFWVSYFGYLSPYSWFAFKAFRTASRRMLDQYAEALNL